MVQHHGIFQSYFFFHLIEKYRTLREQFRGDPNSERTVECCAKYDAPAFNPMRRRSSNRCFAAFSRNRNGRCIPPLNRLDSWGGAEAPLDVPVCRVHVRYWALAAF